MPSFLQPDLQQIISQAVSFLLCLAILKRFAWTPLLGILDARRARIESDLKKAADAKTEMVRLQQDYSHRLAQIEEEARGKIQEAVVEGRRIAADIQEQARAQSTAIIEKSKQTVEQELAKARVMLRDQIARMTIDAAERILRQKLDERTDRQLIDRVLDELEANAPSAPE